MSDVAAQFEWVVAHHNRAGIKGCACGWAELGKSHPLHVLAELEKADLAVIRRPVGEAS